MGCLNGWLDSPNPRTPHVDRLAGGPEAESATPSFGRHAVTKALARNAFQKCGALFATI